MMVLLLQILLHYPLIIARALRVDLHRSQALILAFIPPSLTLPVGWLLKSLNPDSLGPLITSKATQ